MTLQALPFILNNFRINYLHDTVAAGPYVHQASLA